MATMEEKSKDLAEMLKVLANENRLLILCSLVQKPLTVNEILEFVPNIKQSALSQHLSIMKANKILESEKQGQNVKYFIKDEKIIKLFNFLKETYC